MTPLAKWVLAALLRFAPVEALPQFPAFEEAADAARARYASIAVDIAAAAEAESPIPGGLTDRAEAALLVAIAIGESQLSADTDRGPCYRGAPGGRHWGRCDHATSATLWQIKRGLLWDGKRLSYLELFTDRARAARIALRFARASLHTCRRLPAVDRLSGLSGRCVEGHAGARGHYRRWLRIAAWEPAR